MAQHVSAKKRIRQTKRRSEVNRARVSRIRTFLRRVETAIAGGKRDEANVAYHQAQPELMRAADKGVVHRNLMARKLSRLARRIKMLPS
jgi:small subunit ribosomal protein S20